MLTPEEMDRALMRLSAGRIRAIENAPYFSQALLAITPVPKPELGTFAVDSYWRLYFSPSLCLEWTIDEIAAVWLHEVNHLLRKHADRFQGYGEDQFHGIWNASADAAINSDLRDMKVVLPNPENRYYAEPTSQYPNWRRGMTSEEMYSIARGSRLSLPSEESLKGEKSDDDASDGPFSESEEELEGDDSPSDQEPSGDKSDSSDSSDPSDPEGDDAEGEPGDGDTESEGSGDPSDAEGEGGDTEGEGGDGDASGESDGGEDSGGESSDSTEGSGDGGDSAEGAAHGGASDCGSAADGQSRDYEDPPERGETVNDGEADIIRQDTARAVNEYAESHPGTIPGGVKIMADEILNPQVNWVRHLLVRVRQVVAQIAGTRDYSYTRPSRRRNGGDFIFPSMRSGQTPTIYIVIDTSGSMSKEHLRRALSEVAAIIRKARGVTYVISCDVAGTEIQKIRRAEDIDLEGGGGTDMRVGIKLASFAKPKPDIILTVTDGFTPWPKTPYKGAPSAKYLALIVSAIGKPEAGAPKRIPDFIEAIPVGF